MEIAEGLELRPGAEGALPIRVRWVRLVGNIAAVAIDGDRIYVASGTLTAFGLADGSVTWEAEHPEGYALHDSGVVVIGLDGPGVVRAFAPSEYDLRVDRATGRRISYREVVVGDAPADLVALPTPQPSCFRIEADLRETVAFWPDGRVAWRLVVEGPFIDALPRSMSTEPSSVPQAPATWSYWIPSTATTATPDPSFGIHPSARDPENPLGPRWVRSTSVTRGSWRA